MNDSDCSYVLYETMRKYANFTACPRGVYLRDVENGDTKMGMNVPMTETPEYEKRMMKLKLKQEKKQQQQKNKKRM